MAFDPSIFKNVSSRTLGAGCCGEDGSEETTELTFTPELLYFSYLLEGETSEAQPFTITNTGALPVGIASVEVTGDFELTGDIPTELSPNETATLYITFSPTFQGARLGNVIIDAGTTGPQDCVHLIGIGGEDTFSAGLEDLQAQLDAIIAANVAQQEQIVSLQGLLTGYVTEVPSRYMWRAYANSPDGRSDFTTGEPGSRSFIGLAFNKVDIEPSTNPSDYEWSSIGVTIGNVISYDTVNIAGRPATQLLTDFDDLALQLLAYQFDRQQLRDYVDALLYVEGQPVNAAIADLENIVLTGDSALAETLGILGAKTPDGLSFILDLNKVYVDPNLSLGIKLSNMVASTVATQASVQSLQQAIAAADYASVSDLTLLGAKTPDGTAWIMDLDNIYVDGGQTLAQSINTQVAEAAGNEVSVTELYEALITPEGGASAKAVVQLDVNGHVVGYSATNGNGYGQIVFNFDSFIIKHPGSGLALFTVEGGIVKMSNVEIDTLKVNTVTSESIVQGAVTQKLFFSASFGSANGKTLGAPSEDTWAEFGVSGNKVKIVTPALLVNSEVNIRVYVNKRRTGSDNDRVWYRLKRTAPGGAVTYVGDTVQSGMANYATVFTYEWTDTVAAAGVYSYTLEYFRDVGEGTYYSAKMIADIGKR